jgi:hypothetical protein
MDESKLPRDTRGRPNYSYLGHTSDIISTPWANEGAFIEPGMPRRFPKRSERSYAEEKERKRLAEIENPGRCQSRQNRYDSWCKRYPTPGLKVCWYHGGKFAHSRKAAVRNVEEQAVMRKAKSIVVQARK